MPALIFATNNKNKVDEIRAVLQGLFDVISLKEAGIDIEIPEPHDSLEANAREKSTTIHKLTQQDCFSEDTGLEVNYLNGEPGVRSARYAGEEADFKKNIDLLLRNMEGTKQREARFRTVISLILDGKEYQFEGICPGMIVSKESGSNGFGYDPVFIPDGADRTFAEMSMEEKNNFSHRKKATAQLIQFLKQRNVKDQTPNA
jgi:XTP/dITP diphosphohydrolase